MPQEVRQLESERLKRKAPFKRRGLFEKECWLAFCRRGWLNHHVTAAGALVNKLDGAGDFGEKSVILAASDVGPRLDAGAALAHDNGAAGDKLSAEGLYSEPLRVRVATVS